MYPFIPRSSQHSLVCSHGFIFPHHNISFIHFSLFGRVASWRGGAGRRGALQLRNPVENFSFATVRGSAVDMFFRRKSEWANMYRVMEAHDYRTVDEAVQAVRDG